MSSSPLHAPVPRPQPPPVRATGAPAGPGWAWLACAIAVCVSVYLANSWRRDFWAPEEPDFAAVLREMEAGIESGNHWAWLYPTIGGKLYLEKPPLLYWLGLAAKKLTGADPRLAYRLPLALAGALSLAVVYLGGRRFFNARVGVAAAAILGSSYLHFHSASWLLTDMLFASMVGLSVLSFALALRQEPRSRRWALAGWAALALAALAKGLLLAPALALGPIFLFLLSQGSRGLGRGLEALRVVPGLAIFLAIVLPWYVVLYMKVGGAIFQEQIVNQHLLRLVEADSHKQWIGYYLFTLPADFLPWSLFLPLAVFYGKAHFRQEGPRLFAAWSFWTFLLLSLISSKQGKYLLPMWPALSILVAAALLEWERESIWEVWLGEGAFRGLAWGAKALLPVALTAAACYAVGLDGSLSLGDEAREILADRALGWSWIGLAVTSAAAFFLAGIGISRSLRAGQAERAILFLAAAALFTYFALSFTYDDLNRFKSVRALAAEVKQVAGEKPLAVYGNNHEALHYYLARPLEHLEYLDPLVAHSEQEQALDRYLAQEREAFVIIGEKDMKKLLEQFPRYREKLHLVREKLRLGSHRRAYLASNRAPAK